VVQLQFFQERVSQIGDDRCRARVLFLCGSDLFDTFVIPGVWEIGDVKEILQRGVVVIERAGSNNVTETMAKLPQLRGDERPYVVHTVPPHRSNNISSTVVRKALREGKPVQGQLSEAVLSYILQHGLYEAKASF